MFDADTEALVNTVNLKGVMGKGVALQFKERFKANFRRYQGACRSGEIGIGRALVVADSYNGRNQLIINLPTKVDWRHHSEYAYIESGLANLREIIASRKIKSVAMPALGAGNGGLDWIRVREMIVENLSDVDCEIFVYEPGVTPESQSREVKLTRARALLLYMLDKFRKEGYDTTTFSAVKAVYFLQKFGGETIFNLKFIPYFYGPYCDAVRHVLHAMDGCYLHGFSDMNIKAFMPFGLIDDRIGKATEMVETDDELRGIAERTCRFLNDRWDEFNLELLSSVDFLMTANPSASPGDIYLSLCEWSERKRKLYADKELTIEAFRHIQEFPA